MSRLRSDERERGATLVEFALIAPLFFLLLGSMLDIGLAVLGRSVASNAAREGARVGIIQFDNADVVGSPNYNAIRAAAESKLVGLVKPDAGVTPYIEVKCRDGGGTHQLLNGTGSCAKSLVRIDYDLIEVTVRWTSISPAGGVFTPDSYTDRARMVITGGVSGGAGGCASGGTLDFNPTSVTTSEGDGPGTKTVSLTVTRSSSSCVSSVAYATLDGSAMAVSDYIAQPAGLLTFIDGETSKSFDVEIVGDTVPEPDEAFTVVLSGAVNAVIGAGTATVNIDDDDISTVPPSPVFIGIYDRAETAPAFPDGKVDEVVVRFNEDIQPPCGNPGAFFTFPSNPNAVSIASASRTASNEVTLILNEGSADTSQAALTLSLLAGCILDLDGNSASFSAGDPGTTIMDNAAPVLLAVVDDDTANDAADGRFEQNDWVEFRFSEPLRASSLPAVSADVVLRDPNPQNGSGLNDTVDIVNLLTGPRDLGSLNYLTTSNRTATFRDATVALTTGNTIIRVTLVNGCQGGGCSSLGTGGPGPARFTFVTTLVGDSDGFPISSGPITVRLF